MEHVFDTSAGVPAVFSERSSDTVLLLIEDASQLGDRIIAPPLILPEMVNVIRKRARAARFSIDVAQHYLDTFLALPIQIVDEPGLARRALALSLRHGFGGQDAYYVALAEARGCDLWVDDGRLLRAAGALPFVRWIGGYTGR